MKTSDYFKAGFIEKMMQQHSSGSGIKVLNVNQFPVDNSASILSTLNAGTTGLEIGHFGLEVDYIENETPKTRKMVMKVKPHGLVTAGMLNSLSALCSDELNAVYSQFQDLTGFSNTHMRELEIYQKAPAVFQPEIFGLEVDEPNQIFLILMEYLDDVVLINSVMQPGQWQPVHIKESLTKIAQWHAEHLSTQDSLDPQYWSKDVPSKKYMEKMQPLWTALLNNASKVLPEVYTVENRALLYEAIEKIPQYWDELEKMPKTLIHNDFNPRNTCFKKGSSGLELCLYDWELATFHIPQYDVAEFLSFILRPETYHLRKEYLEFYRSELNKLTGKFEDKKKFEKGFFYASLDLGLHRFGMYTMAHTVSPYPFLPAVLRSYFDSLQSMKHLLP
ncbi:MAG: phosphotransferase [Gillisia sp.]